MTKYDKFLREQRLEELKSKIRTGLTEIEEKELDILQKEAFEEEKAIKTLKCIPFYLLLCILYGVTKAIVSHYFLQ